MLYGVIKALLSGALVGLVPEAARRGVGFSPALLAGCALTVVLYGVTVAVAARDGVRL